MKVGILSVPSLTGASKVPQNGKTRKGRRIVDAMRDRNMEVRLQAIRELDRLIVLAREGLNGHVTVTILVSEGALKRVRTEVVNHMDNN